MKRLNRLAHWTLICAAILFVVNGAIADEKDRQVLEDILRQTVAKIDSTGEAQSTLLLRSFALSAEIDELKRASSSVGGPFRNPQLLSRLNKSVSLALETAKLDQEIYKLTQEAIKARRLIIENLDDEIADLTARAEQTVGRREKSDLLETALELQKARDAHSAGVARQSRVLLLALDVQLAETDAPDDILRKIDIVADQRDVLLERIARSESEVNAAQERRGLAQGMLELLLEMRRDEDDEFDLDRNLRIGELEAELTEIADRETLLNAQIARWRARIERLDAKTEQFETEFRRMIRPQTNEGEP